MLRAISLTLLALAISLLGGAASVAYVLRPGHNFGAVRVGPWTTYPRLGTLDADPYARAEVSRTGILALGRAEGVAFTALSDNEGRPLDAACAYLLSGQPPQGRFWTLRAEPIRAVRPSPPSALHSQGLMRKADNSVDIAISREPRPGNWLPLRSSGRMRLVLTVYDASSIAGAVSSDIDMPSIVETGCDE